MMIFELVFSLSIIANGFADTISCLDMDIMELCSQREVCSEQVPDFETLCRVYLRSRGRVETTERDIETVSYRDASVPQILFLTPNQTVAPGDEFTIECVGEGAPSPHLEITYLEDADTSSLMDNSNEVTITKSVIQKQMVQPFAIYEDEGWFRCVAKNSQGIVYQDTYLTVATSDDLCKSVSCEGLEVCEIVEGEATCNCPRCTAEDHESDPFLYCGSDCGVYFSKCSLAEANCEQDSDIQIFRNNYCPTFSLPLYGYEASETEVVAFGTEIQLLCYGTPHGENPGPVPVITWYNEFGEVVGYGEVFTMRVRGNTMLTCVGTHCPASQLQKHDTHIKTFDIVVEDFLTLSTSEQNTVTMTTPSPSASTTIPATPSYPMARASATSAVCDVIPGPYIRTFDGLWYVNEGSCTYVLSMDCAAGAWSIYARFTECGTMATCLESATLYIGRRAVQLQRGWVINNGGEKVQVKLGEEVDFGDTISYVFDGEYLIFAFGNDNQIRWNGYNGLQVLTQPGQRRCGLCGNNNGNPDDDLQPRRQRQVASTTYEFVRSWGFNMQPECYEHHVDVTDTQESKEACDSVFLNDAVSKCHYTVPVREFLAACYRFRATNPLPHYPEFRPECNVLQSYVMTCETRGVTHLRQWRDGVACTRLEEMQKVVISQGCPQDNPPV